MANVTAVDFLVIGAGIAGTSVAASLAAEGRVAVLDMEAHCGYHSTGRSAALFSEIYGNDVIRGLTRASREFLFNPPDYFTATPLATPRSALFFARPDQKHLLDGFLLDPEILKATRRLSANEVRARIPIFRDDYLDGGAIEEGSADLDVDAIHQGFLRQIKSRKSTIHVNALVRGISRCNGLWVAKTDQASFWAPVLINAAGAWGDAIAQLAGVPVVGLEPKRRTACLIPVPDGLDAHAWPAAVDISEQFYFKPDAGQLLLSPADEHPSPACDVQPDEFDVATAVDRFEGATGRQVKQVRHQWAGLRVFAPDRTPVVGFEPSVEGFFWLAGQGGYGIQTSPAMGQLAAALVTGKPVPDSIARFGVSAHALSRQRLQTTTMAEA